ncbi:ABC transporter ATP-binding protein [Notoacmeibacter ruber]|uniref:sn-glycerol-3-phosphate ABC transporter ATP-binding protein UgpC n=1 Tax=Notoacmeibacter ruber TaxID=2670375 RepID=A0A3L7J3Z9_9HYPH|nr:sn-glycerol-3-phosphate ABC transporter ATP-binding protein UgpC [Notoacmeibacter ruber]RLQ85297.1 sn-glycerol-3-phosphate ABC transporter ATP-binding protein UgpC [Notoacmeibacter ruber]
MADVTIDRVNKEFGAVKVLKNIELEIRDGEFLVLVGPSGCGKSTLLRMIAGLESVTAGNISIGGAKVNGVAPKDRDIAMVFQSYALYPHMNVRKNLSFALRIRKASEEEIEKRVKLASEILGLSELMDRLPKQLSGGQRQRVAMGRAIVRDPQVFLFDEPLSNLDAKLRIQMRKEIKELHQRLKTTSIYVTHDQIEALTMADRVVVMRDGVIEQAGPPLELYDRPANIFVAGFIGAPAMNFIKARVDRGEVAPRLLVGNEMLLPIPEGADIGRDDVTLGIRPEHITISETETGATAIVKVLEPTGNETLLECDLDGTRIDVVIRERTDIAPGASINLAFDPARLHLFSPESGLRLNA